MYYIEDSRFQIEKRYVEYIGESNQIYWFFIFRFYNRLARNKTYFLQSGERSEVECVWNRYRMFTSPLWTSSALYNKTNKTLVMRFKISH
jgi:hypothetical protein